MLEEHTPPGRGVPDPIDEGVEGPGEDGLAPPFNSHGPR